MPGPGTAPRSREAAISFEQALQALAHLPEDGDTRGLAIELRLALGHPADPIGRAWAAPRPVERGRGPGPSARQLTDRQSVTPRPVPVLTSPRATLRFFLGDCLELMPAFPAASLDVVVTSPPYNLGIRYRSYADRLPRQRYLDWTGAWVAALRAGCGPKGRSSSTSAPSPRIRGRRLTSPRPHGRTCISKTPCTGSSPSPSIGTARAPARVWSATWPSGTTSRSTAGVS